MLILCGHRRFCTCKCSEPLSTRKYIDISMTILWFVVVLNWYKNVGSTGAKKGKRKVQGVPQSETAALPRPQEEEETDKYKQVQTEQTYEKH